MVESKVAFQVAISVAKAITAAYKRLAESGWTYKSQRPELKEILVYGSVARLAERVGDVDLFVLDNGAVSGYCQDRIGNKRITGVFGFSGLVSLVEVFAELLFDDEFNNPLFTQECGVDVKPLPVSLLYDADVRSEIAAAQYDKLFFQKAFSNLLQFSFEQEIFFLERGGNLMEAYGAPEELFSWRPGISPVVTARQLVLPANRSDYDLIEQFKLYGPDIVPAALGTLLALAARKAPSGSGEYGLIDAIVNYLTPANAPALASLLGWDEALPQDGINGRSFKIRLLEALTLVGTRSEIPALEAFRAKIATQTYEPRFIAMDYVGTDTALAACATR